jgi:hypothetical protein
VVWVILLFSILLWAGMQPISQIQPEISQATFDLANYIQESTPPSATLLSVVRVEDAEWHPFLFRRTPVIASWGSEWIGTYPQQFKLIYEIESCRTSQDASCIEDLITRTHITPDYILTYTSATGQTDQILKRQRWKLVYQNTDYLLWQTNQ